MKRGRPRDDFPVAQFPAALRAKMDILGLTQTQLAKRSGVKRWELSRVLRGLRPASRAVRVAVSSVLGFTAEERIRFVCFLSPQEAPKPMLIGEYEYLGQATLSEAAALLHHGFYRAAAREFKRIFHAAERNADLITQANAAGRAALVYLEMGSFDEAQQWAFRSIAKCSECVGMPVAEIIRNASRYSPARSPSKSERAARTLSDTLHNLCQIYVRQMLYCENQGLEPRARVSLQNSLKLDRRLDLPQPFGNDIRCRAVVEIIGNPPNSQLALKLIDQCKDNFAAGGLFEAHRVKTAGIIALQTDKPAKARDILTEAATMLSSFPDDRGLASAWHMLSDAILRTRFSSRTRQQALRYIISAAALHPYGPVIDRCMQQARCADRRNLQAEIDDLISGKGLYSVVHRMTKWMAEGSPYTAEDLLFRNIDLMMTGNFPQVELPDRQTSGYQPI